MISNPQHLIHDENDFKSKVKEAIRSSVRNKSILRDRILALVLYQSAAHLFPEYLDWSRFDLIFASFISTFGKLVLEYGHTAISENSEERKKHEIEYLWNKEVWKGSVNEKNEHRYLRNQSEIKKLYARGEMVNTDVVFQIYFVFYRRNNTEG